MLGLKHNPPDLFLLVVVMSLLVIGLVIVTSASAPKSLDDTGGASVFHYGLKQFILAVVGMGILLFMVNYPYPKFKRFTIPLIILTVGLLVLVLTPLGWATKGARRWFNLGFFLLQPSELAKITVIMFLAHYLAEIKKGVNNFIVGVIFPLILVAMVCGLIMLEPDLGTTIVIFGTFMAILFAAGARASHLSLLTLSGVAMGSLLIIVEPYRLQRIFAFLNPWQDPQGAGWQIINSLYALGSGGPFGMGLGLSRQKFNYLPEAHTDYIFSILGEEMGLLGTATVLILFFCLAWRGYKIALTAPDTYGRLLATGITSYLIFQALLNIGVVTSSIPVTGITLPFLSYGGSSLIVSLFGVGILLNISKNQEWG